ncbi:MAG: DUF5317 family protein [Candidatus Yanofskybacteria bacterium]|nr:DUF5317 family protein [Candidatus Yanofskybacteria bacterium]
MIDIFTIIGALLFFSVTPFLEENIRGGKWLILLCTLFILMAILRIPLSGGISEFTQIIKIGVIAILLLLWFKNKTQLGFLVISMGLASNTLVIFVNGGMPVSSDFSGDFILPTGYLIANDQTVLTVLSDWIPGLFWEEYVSPGDYLLSSAFYIFWFQNRKNKPA